MTINDIKTALAAKAQNMNIRPVAPAGTVKPSTPAKTKPAATKTATTTTTATPVPVTKDVAPVVTAPVKVQNQPMVEPEPTARPKSTRMAKAVAENTVNPLEIEAVIHKILVPGRDYGQIKGFTKPSLFKSGAERLLAYFGFTTRAELVSCTELWQDNFVAYTVKVTVVGPDGSEISTGYGECNSRERRFAKISVYDAANCAIKLSVKRGICDAALRVCCASFFMTQDEDMAVDTMGTRLVAAK